MVNNNSEQKRWVIGEWTFDGQEGSLISPTQALTLTPQQTRLLAALIAQYGRLCSKEHLIKEVWNDRVVTDDAITRAVSELRRQLAAAGDEQQYIKTLHGKGYQFVANVQEVGTKAAKVNVLKLVAIAGILLILALVSARYVFKEDVHLTHWPVTVKTLKTDLTKGVRYFPVPESFGLLYSQKKQEAHQLIWKNQDESKLLHQSDLAITKVSLSPDSKQLAWVESGSSCILQLLDLLSLQLKSLLNCNGHGKIQFTWQTNDNSLVAAQLTKPNQVSLYRFGTSLSSEIIKVPECNEVFGVQVTTVQRILIGCSTAKSDRLYSILDDKVDTLVQYRSIEQFQHLDNFVYMRHSPSWKNGITRFNLEDGSYQFATTGVIEDIAVHAGQLLLLRNLRRQLPYFYSEAEGEVVLTDGKFHTAALAVDASSGKLWTLDDRNGPFQLLGDGQVIAGLDLPLEQAKTVKALYISTNEEYLMLTLLESGVYTHHFYLLQNNRVTYLKNWTTDLPYQFQFGHYVTTKEDIEKGKWWDLKEVTDVHLGLRFKVNQVQNICQGILSERNQRFIRAGGEREWTLLHSINDGALQQIPLSITLESKQCEHAQFAYSTAKNGLFYLKSIDDYQDLAVVELQ